jgi:hypothetical protein
VGALTLLAVGAAGAGAGPVWSPETLERYFRVEWAAAPVASGSSVTGWVTNVGPGPAERIELVIERLDATGAVVGSSRTWVVGGLPASQRGSFGARVPAAAAYRVRILAFDWANCRN